MGESDAVASADEVIEYLAEGVGRLWGGRLRLSSLNVRFHCVGAESCRAAYGQLRPLRLTGSMSESGQSCLSRIRGEDPLTGVIRTEDHMLYGLLTRKIKR